MALTTPPTAPNRAEPTSFSARMDDFLAWLVAAVPEFNALSLMTSSGTFTTGTEAAPSINFSGDTDTGLYRPSSNAIGFVGGATEYARFSATGSLMLGTKNVISGLASLFQLQAITSAKAQVSVMLAQANVAGCMLNFIKSRGAALDDYAIVATNDTLGSVAWRGADGTTQILAAQLLAYVDNTPALGDVRAGLSFRTGNGAGTVGEALKIDTNQKVLAVGQGLGYGTGAGGSVTQATSKATGVTLNKAAGVITTHNAALAAATAVQFTLTNSLIGVNDVVIATIQSPTAKYRVACVGTAAGSAIFELTNITAGSLSEAVLINFAVMKSANS